MTEVTNNPSRSRYELRIDGELVGIADYSIDGDVVVIPHTEVERSRRGRGFGAILVRGALDDIREHGRTVVPRCWYVAQFIDENRDYADLLAA